MGSNTENEIYFCINCGAKASRDPHGIVRHTRTHARHCDLDDDTSLEAEIND
jgi:hypothetical protein